MWKLQSLRWRSASGEAAKCVALSLRDLGQRGLWWRSALLCIGATTLWVWLYVHFGAFFLELSAHIALIAFLGLVSRASMNSGNASPSTMSNMGSLNGLPELVTGMASIAQVALLALTIAAIFYVALFIFGILATLRISLRWVLLERARQAVAERYPGWQLFAIAPQPVRTLRGWADMGIRLLLALCIPGAAVLVALRILLEANVRLMYVAAANGVIEPGQRRALASRQGPAILVLGLLLFLLMLVPIVNLAVPVLLCGSVCHLQRRGWVDSHASPLPTVAERRSSWRFIALHVLAVGLGGLAVAALDKAEVKPLDPYVLCLMFLIACPLPLALYEFILGAWRHAATHLMSVLVCLVMIVLSSSLYMAWADGRGA